MFQKIFLKLESSNENEFEFNMLTIERTHNLRTDVHHELSCFYRIPFWYQTQVYML